MPRISVLLSALLALGTGAAVQAETVSVTPDGTWYDFDVDVENFGTDWISLDGTKIEFTIDSLLPVLLTVVDTGFAGDTFNVFDNGNLLGATSSGVNSFPNSVGINADAALADSNYSFRLFQLGAGSHLITGALLTSALALGDPLNLTSGALRAAVVPLPASGLLLLGGSALLGALRRRRAAAGV